MNYKQENNKKIEKSLKAHSYLKMFNCIFDKIISDFSYFKKANHFSHSDYLVELAYS